jgi:hypothetical protein
MVLAVGMRLAEAASENLGLIVVVIAIVALVILWPKLVRLIERWTHRH